MNVVVTAETCILQCSVAVLIFHKTRSQVIFVKQFRPGENRMLRPLFSFFHILVVYLVQNKDKLKNHPVFNTPLNKKRKVDSGSAVKEPSEDYVAVEDLSTVFTPGSSGMTYELCAGVVDSENSYEQITKEEIFEECGYNVPLNCIEKITSYHSSVGVSGSYQTLFYTEVTDEMLVSRGGGSAAEGEMIEVVYVPVEELQTFAFDETKRKTPSLILAVLWFIQNKLPNMKK